MILKCWKKWAFYNFFSRWWWSSGQIRDLMKRDIQWPEQNKLCVFFVLLFSLDRVNNKNVEDKRIRQYMSKETRNILYFLHSYRYYLLVIKYEEKNKRKVHWIKNKWPKHVKLYYSQLNNNKLSISSTHRSGYWNVF